MEENLPPVLLPNEIVPFFIDVKDEENRFFEIIQIRLNEANAEKMANDISEDMGLPANFRQAIFSFLETQIADYQNLTEMHAATEWAKKGSAVHFLNVEASTDTVVYCDVFEWDIFDREMDPDAFSRLTIKELALPGEFVNTISAQIRHQVIKFRSMHAFPEKFAEYIKTNPSYKPQSDLGFRPVQDLLDVSPAVGLKSLREVKSSSSSRDRDRRANRRSKTFQSDALHSLSESVITKVNLVPVVRPIPMPEDSTTIDLAALPSLLEDDEPLSQEELDKVAKKLDQARFVPAPSQQSDDSDGASEDRY